MLTPAAAKMQQCLRAGLLKHEKQLAVNTTTAKQVPTTLHKRETPLLTGTKALASAACAGMKLQGHVQFCTTLLQAVRCCSYDASTTR
jgi:hypothetical protein